MLMGEVQFQDFGAKIITVFRKLTKKKSSDRGVNCRYAKQYEQMNGGSNLPNKRTRRKEKKHCIMFCT
jgi:hypothetical protein